MPIEINEIKHIRKKVGLTQKQLADRAQVSQSLIAKIEAGLLDPTYSNAQKILGALQDIGSKQEAKANELMTAKIISVSPKEDIKNAVEKMKKFNISQMPVIEDHKSIGLVSETIILEAMLNKKGKKIQDIMEDAAPVVPINSTISVISDLLKFYPLILVSEEGKLKGIITKADLLAKIYK